jgi:hypothetical protein
MHSLDPRLSRFCPKANSIQLPKFIRGGNVPAQQAA